jgi:type III secretion system FlhB-like substrate exporter
MTSKRTSLSFQLRRCSGSHASIAINKQRTDCRRMAASQDLDGDEMLAEARRLGIPVVEDASMVDQLIGHVGDRIPKDTYTPVARLLVRFGV